MIEQLICELSTAARELVSGSRRTPSSATDGLRSKNPGAAASRRQKSSVFSTACATASLRLSARRLGGRSWHVVGACRPGGPIRTGEAAAVAEWAPVDVKAQIVCGQFWDQK